MNNLQNLLPSGQALYMQNLVEGGSNELVPPTIQEVKEWKTLYPMYLNNEFSSKNGRRLPIKLCVKNPRPDEIYDAIKSLGIRGMLEMVSFF